MKRKMLKWNHLIEKKNCTQNKRKQFLRDSLKKTKKKKMWQYLRQSDKISYHIFMIEKEKWQLNKRLKQFYFFLFCFSFFFVRKRLVGKNKGKKCYPLNRIIK